MVFLSNDILDYVKKFQFKISKVAVIGINLDVYNSIVWLSNQKTKYSLIYQLFKYGIIFSGIFHTRDIKCF